MSRKLNLLVFLSCVAIALTAHLAGCATTGHKQGAKTASSMNDAQDELLKTKGQIEATTTILNEFGKQEGIDLPTQYKEFGKAIDSVESQFRKARKRVEKVNEEGTKFFQEWEKEAALITNQDLKDRSEKRKNNLLGSFNKIGASMQPAEETYNAFMSDLRDIEKYLSIDLTPEGLVEISDTIKKANADGSKLQKQIDAVIAELSRVTAEMPVE